MPWAWMSPHVPIHPFPHLAAMKVKKVFKDCAAVRSGLMPPKLHGGEGKAMEVLVQPCLHLHKALAPLRVSHLSLGTYCFASTLTTGLLLQALDWVLTRVGLVGFGALSALSKPIGPRLMLQDSLRCTGRLAAQRRPCKPHGKKYNHPLVLLCSSRCVCCQTRNIMLRVASRALLEGVQASAWAPALGSAAQQFSTAITVSSKNVPPQDYSLVMKKAAEVGAANVKKPLDKEVGLCAGIPLDTYNRTVRTDCASGLLLGMQ